MMNENERNLLQDLVRRKLLGALDSEGEEKLSCWRSVDKVNEDIFRSVSERAAKGDDREYYHESTIDEAWIQTRNRLGKARHKRLIVWWFGTAAAIVFLFLGIGALMTREHAVQSLEMESEYGIPHTERVVLTSNDGNVVVLDSCRHDSIRVDGTVARNDKGLLVYRKSELASDDVKFNTLTVPAGAEYSLALADGTKVWLNAKSRIVYPVSFVGKQRKVILEGEACFDVARDSLHPFVVSTTRVDVEVLGTFFNINAYSDEEEVVTTLIKGCVKVSHNDTLSCILKPSQQSVYSSDRKDFRVREVNARYYIQWINGCFVFRNEKLETIMRTLSRLYGIECIFRNSSLKEERFYGTLDKYMDVRILLDQIEQTGKVRFKYAGSQIIITR